MKRRHFIQNALLTPAVVPFLTKIPAGRPTTGILVRDGKSRNNEKIICAVTPIDFKVLSTDTNGDLAIFISANNRKGDGPPLHVHHTFDEFFCVLDGEFLFQVGDEKTYLKPGDTLFVPRTVKHAFNCVSTLPGKLLVSIQPASNMESFFRGVAKLLPGLDSPVKGPPDREAMQKLYAAHDSTIVGPPVAAE